MDEQSGQEMRDDHGREKNERMLMFGLQCVVHVTGYSDYNVTETWMDQEGKSGNTYQFRIRNQAATTTTVAVQGDSVTFFDGWCWP